MKGIKYLALFSIAFFTLLLIFPTSSSPQVPGVSDTEIKIGLTTDLSGIIAYWGNGILFGTQTIVNQVNDAGGVHGRKLKLIYYDDGYVPAKALANVKRMVEQDEVFGFLGNLGTPTVAATIPYIMEKGVPLIPSTFTSPWAYPTKKWVFMLPATYQHQAYLMAEFLVKDLKKSRIGILSQDDSYGKDGYTGLKNGLEKLGMKFVAEETYKRGSIDVSPQIAKLRMANADAVALIAIEIPAAQVVKEASKVGWKPAFMLLNATCTRKYIELAGEEGEGAYCSQVYPDAQSDLPKVAEFRDLLKKYFPKEKPDLPNLHSYTLGLVFVEALKRAGKDLTREKFVAAMENLKNFETGILPPLTMGPDDHQGSTGVVFMRVQKGTLVPASDWKIGPELHQQ